MSDKIPESRIRQTPRRVADLAPGDEMSIHPAAFTVMPDRSLVIAKDLTLDSADNTTVTIGRRASGAYYIDARSRPDFKFRLADELLTRYGGDNLIVIHELIL